MLDPSISKELLRTGTFEAFEVSTLVLCYVICDLYFDILVNKELLFFSSSCLAERAVIMAVCWQTKFVLFFGFAVVIPWALNLRAGAGFLCAAEF